MPAVFENVMESQKDQTNIMGFAAGHQFLP